VKNRGFSLDRPNRATCLLFVLFYLFTGLHNALQLLSSKLPTISILTTLETRNTLPRSHTLRGTGHAPGSRLTLTLQQKTPAESLTEKLKYLTVALAVPGSLHDPQVPQVLLDFHGHHCFHGLHCVHGHPGFPGQPYCHCECLPSAMSRMSATLNQY
jgi:hypothetical protein